MKLRRYAPTKGNQQKTDRTIDIIDKKREKREKKRKEEKKERRREKKDRREKKREKREKKREKYIQGLLLSICIQFSKRETK